MYLPQTTTDTIMNEMGLNAFQVEQGKWAARTFGEQTTEEKLRHLHKEIDEIIDDQTDVVEYADALSLLLDAARLQGIRADQILIAAWNNLDVNMRRTWTKNPDGTFSGSKSTDARRREQK